MGQPQERSQANSSNIGVDSEKFGNHYKVLGNGTAGGRMLRQNDPMYRDNGS